MSNRLMSVSVVLVSEVVVQLVVCPECQADQGREECQDEKQFDEEVFHYRPIHFASVREPTY